MDELLFFFLLLEKEREGSEKRMESRLSQFKFIRYKSRQLRGAVTHCFAAAGCPIQFWSQSPFLCSLDPMKAVSAAQVHPAHEKTVFHRLLFWEGSNDASVRTCVSPPQQGLIPLLGCSFSAENGNSLGGEARIGIAEKRERDFCRREMYVK